MPRRVVPARLAAVQAVPAQRPRVPLTILYGSESGNAEALAYKAKKTAAKLNCDAKVVDMGDIDVAALAKSKNLAVYVSTWGEGDPPQRAVDFYKDLMSDAAPRLDGVKYAVLSLGDTAYVNFCETGKKIDARLAELGATRIHDRIDLDLDFAKAASAWTDALLEKFSPAVEAPSATVVHVDFKSAAIDDEPAEPLYTAEDPAEAEISALVNLNGSGSTRETYHVELAVEADGFTYEPGAAIGVLPENDPALAADVARAVGLDGDASLVLKIARGYDITTLSRATVDAYAKLTGRKDVAKLTDARGAGQVFGRPAAGRSVVGRIAEKLTAEQLLGLLRPLPGRLYSVASSIKAHPGEAHLADRRSALGEPRAQARRRGFDVFRGSAQGRRQGACVREAEPALRAARRRQSSDHHDRCRHGRRALSRVHRGAVSKRAPRARAGCSSASATTRTTSSTSSNGRIIWRRVR